MNVHILDKQDIWLKINGVMSFLRFRNPKRLEFYGKKGKILAIIETENIADIWVGDSRLWKGGLSNEAKTV